MGGLLLSQQLSAIENIALNQSVELVSLFLILLKKEQEICIHIYTLEKSNTSFHYSQAAFTVMTCTEIMILESLLIHKNELQIETIFQIFQEKIFY